MSRLMRDLSPETYLLNPDTPVGFRAKPDKHGHSARTGGIGSLLASIWRPVCPSQATWTRRDTRISSGDVGWARSGQSAAHDARHAHRRLCPPVVPFGDRELARCGRCERVADGQFEPVATPRADRRRTGGATGAKRSVLSEGARVPRLDVVVGAVRVLHSSRNGRLDARSGCLSNPRVWARPARGRLPSGERSGAADQPASRAAVSRRMWASRRRSQSPLSTYVRTRTADDAVRPSLRCQKGRAVRRPSTQGVRRRATSPV
jgi:hypothetical protein